MASFMEENVVDPLHERIGERQMTERVRFRSKERCIFVRHFGGAFANVLHSFMEESVVDPLHERIGER